MRKLENKISGPTQPQQNQSLEVRQDVLKISKFVRDELCISQRQSLLIGTNIKEQKSENGGGASAHVQSRAGLGAGPSPVEAVHHGAPGEAARDAGPSQGHGAGRLAQVVPDGSYPVHVAAAGAQAARQAPDAALPDAGVVPRLCHRRGVCTHTQTLLSYGTALGCS